MSLASLNSSGIQSSNPALYQTVKDIYDQLLQLQNAVDSYGFTFASDTKQLSLKNSLNVLAGQIQFPNVQNPSPDINTLDDYEEGIWNPILGGETSQAGQVYNALTNGRYVKFGKVVFVQAYIWVTTKGAVVGNLVIRGLPFTIEDIPPIGAGFASMYANYWSTWTSALCHLGGHFVPNTNYIRLTGLTAGAVTTPTLSTADIADGSQCIISGCYRATP